MSLCWILRNLLNLISHCELALVAVCSGGAALYSPGSGGAYFQQLLDEVPVGVKFVVSLICGNDIYWNKFTDALRFAAEDSCDAVSAKAQTHSAVVGMSAATWQYDASWAGAYDAKAAALLDVFRSRGVACCNGAAELQGLRLSDSFGHVHPDSQRIVFDAYKLSLIHI